VIDGTPNIKFEKDVTGCCLIRVVEEAVRDECGTVVE
jgi:hypothetical protein